MAELNSSIDDIMELLDKIYDECGGQIPEIATRILTGGNPKMIEFLVVSGLDSLYDGDAARDELLNFEFHDGTRVRDATPEQVIHFVDDINRVAEAMEKQGLTRSHV